MLEPILRVRLTVVRRVLDVDILVLGVKVDCCDYRCLTRLRACDVHRGEEWHADQIHVLPGDGEDAHHGPDSEGAHSTGVVIAGDTDQGCIELAGDVGVHRFSGKAGPLEVMELEAGKEGLFVADVHKILCVKIVQA